MKIAKIPGIQDTDSLGIITATYNRPRFVKKVLANLKKQTNPNFHFVMVHDGPNGAAHELFTKYSDD